MNRLCERSEAIQLLDRPAASVMQVRLAPQVAAARGAHGDLLTAMTRMV
jgi:hypothetical protein